MNTEPFEKVLRRVIGGRYLADRRRIFRNWWRSDYRGIMLDWSYSGPTVEPEEIIALLKRNGVDGKLVWVMEQRIPEWRKLRNTEQRREAAQSRWKKNH